MNCETCDEPIVEFEPRKGRPKRFVHGGELTTTGTPGKKYDHPAKPRGANGMLASVSKERFEALENLAAFLRGSDSTITNALRVFARNMREAAEECRKAYESGLGTETQEPSPGHVSVAITNNGYKNLAAQFTQQAEAAECAADEIEKRLDLLMDIE